MLDLLDANVLIDANRDYYPIDRVPEFWEWLADLGERGLVKVPPEIYDEIVNPPPARRDAVVEWLKERRDALLFDEGAQQSLVARVTKDGYASDPDEDGYASDLDDVEIVKIGRDPFLIAYALVDPQNRRVISNERSRRSATRANRKVPDVCANLGIVCWHTFRFIQERDFRTDWRTR